MCIIIFMAVERALVLGSGWIENWATMLLLWWCDWGSWPAAASLTVGEKPRFALESKKWVNWDAMWLGFPAFSWLLSWRRREEPWGCWPTSSDGWWYGAGLTERLWCCCCCWKLSKLLRCD